MEARRVAVLSSSFSSRSFAFGSFTSRSSYIQSLCVGRCDRRAIATRVFTPDLIPLAPQDPLYSLVAAYEADQCPDKVDLGVGAYRDDKAKPWILPAIHKADRIYREDPNLDHEYLPIAGLPDFNKAAQKLILGGDSPAIKEDRVCTFQAISGTGAVHLGAAFLSKFLHTPKPTVYISDPTWPIHNQVFTHVGLTVQHYPYFSQSTKMMDFNGMISCLQKAARGSIVVLHACAHNQTGVDLTEDQWRRIAQVMRESDLFPFFDCAYQGFATGSLTKDNFAIRYFLEEGFNMVIAQSFAKNFGLYGQRAGAVHVVTAPGPTAQDMTKRIASQLSIISRSEMSSPPIYGAKLVSIVLNDTQLFREWQENLLTMSGRIIDMRVNLKQDLDRLQTPGNWDHITSQVGMFTFTGLNASQVCQMKGKWHVYMAGNGRISMAGLNKGNVKYFAKAIDSVVRYPN